MLPVQHLSDEAIAAFADGVLSAAARARAVNHLLGCPDCAHAVNVQREAASVLRTAPLPAAPTGLVERLRAVPVTTPIQRPDLALAPDGTTYFAAHRVAGAAAPTARRVRPAVFTAAALAVLSAVTAGGVARGRVAHRVVPPFVAPAVSSDGTLSSLQTRDPADATFVHGRVLGR